MVKDKKTIGEARNGEALQGLVNHSGWQVVKNMFAQEEADALRALKNPNSEESEIRMAQATIGVIERLIHQIEVGIGFGEQAKNKINRSK